jgi:cytochrome bd ubiquinol oxidase subunit II
VNNTANWLPLAYAAVTAGAFLAYVLMDGWDLGVGILYPLIARKPDRDQLMETIAPFWDANETWLVFGGMMLLLGFPLAYSTLLAELYMPVMGMLFGLVLRGASYEFRFQGGSLREFWGYVFAGGSVLAAFAQGCMLGRIVEGIVQVGPISAVLTVFRDAFPLLCGIGLIGGYALLGACWLILKSGGALQTTAREVAQSTLLTTAFLLMIVSTFTPIVSAHVATRWFSPRTLWLTVIAVVGHVGIGWKLWTSIWQSSDRRPLQWAIALFVLAFLGIAISLYPYIVPYQYTLVAAANDHSTLVFGSVGICIVLPVVFLYLILGYRVFQGKSKLPLVPRGATAPSLASRKTSGHQSDLHMS